MGIIDPMVIGNAAAMGGLEFSVGPALWALTTGLLATSAIAIALSGIDWRRLARLSLPRLAHAQLATVGVSRAK